MALSTDTGAVRRMATAHGTLTGLWAPSRFDAADWEVATRYTDDTVAQAAAQAAASVQVSLEDYRTSTDATIAQTPTQILATVASTYARSTEVADLYAELSSELSILDGEVAIRIGETVESIARLADDLATDIASREAWYRFTSTQMEIGRKGSLMMMVLDNAHLGLMQGATEVAGFYADHVYNSNVEVGSTIKQGVAGVGYFAWIFGADGSLALKKVSN